MPRGIYERKKTPEQIAMWKRNLAKGRTPKARAKAKQKLKENAKNPEWRKKVSDATKRAMRTENVRKKHLAGLGKAFGYDYFSITKSPIPISGTLAKLIGIEYINRFWSRVSIKSDDECWEFQGSGKAIGYGTFWIGDKEIQAHRFALMLQLGRDLQENEQALHHCDNPPCCNPAHLFLGDIATNVADKMAKGRHKTLGKLTKQQVQEIRKLYATGHWTLRQLSQKYQRSVESLRKVVKGIVWKNID